MESLTCSFIRESVVSRQKIQRVVKKIIIICAPNEFRLGTGKIVLRSIPLKASHVAHMVFSQHVQQCSVLKIKKKTDKIKISAKARHILDFNFLFLFILSTSVKYILYKLKHSKIDMSIKAPKSNIKLKDRLKGACL